MTTSFSLTIPQPPCRSILLVDNDLTIVKVTEKMLYVLGHYGRIAADGYEAPNQYNNSKETIDLVITDLVMPGMDGRDLVLALKAANPTLDIEPADSDSWNGYSLQNQAAHNRFYLA